MPPIDVVMPTFNRPRDILRAAVESAAASPLIHRIIVIDDGSTTAASELLADLDPRIEVLRQDNAGPSAARNRGLETSTAPYLLLLDDDDELVPASLEPMIALAENFGASAILGAREEFGAGLPIKPLPWPSDLTDRPWPDRRDVFRPLSALRGGALIRRSPAIAPLRFDPSLKIYEDKEYLYQCAAHGPTVASSTLSVRVRRWPTGESLTSPHHLDRRVTDHIAIQTRYPELRDFAGWREQTRWLLRSYAKQGHNAGVWSRARKAASECAVKPGLKASVRGLARFNF
jgi:glycosyltransferase involved in cell wall biosynthesis